LNLDEKQIKPFTEEWIQQKNKQFVKKLLVGFLFGLIVISLFVLDGATLYQSALSKMGIMTKQEAKALLVDFEDHYFGQFVFEYKDYSAIKLNFLKARSMTYHAFYEYVDSIAVMANDYTSSFIFNTPEVKYYDNYFAKLQDISPVLLTKEMGDTPVGYIQMKALSHQVNNQIAVALKDFEEQGVKSLIIDVTESPLGTTEETVRFLDYFISSDEIVRYQTKDGFYQVFRAQTGAYTFDNLYVLINEDVSGPGEIIAASLKNHLKNKVDLVGKVPYGTQHLFHYTINEPHSYIFKYAIGLWQVGNAGLDEVKWDMSVEEDVSSLEKALQWIENDLK
jgi:hypothetical protein